MSASTYLLVMGGVAIAMLFVVLPILLTKKCPACNKRSYLEAKSCKHCGAAFPEDEAS